MGIFSEVPASSPPRVSLAVDLALAISVFVRQSYTQMIERLSEAYAASSQKEGSFSFSKNFQHHNNAVAMNVVVTSHQLVCLYSLAGGEGEPPGRVYWLIGGPVITISFIFIFNNKLREGVFRTFGIQKPSYFSRIELVIKNDLAPRRGYCWGSSSQSKVPKTKISFESDNNGCQSYSRRTIAST
jgi:hypothetical protein